MFTGIIEKPGRVKGIERQGGSARLTVMCEEEGLRAGDSIAVDGVCLTVVTSGRGSFTADLSPETLTRSTLGDLNPGTLVNLERPLSPSDRLGGHFVLGHVDGVGRVVALTPEGNSIRAEFNAPAVLSPYLVEKGSVAVDGISLTVASCTEKGFSAALIPYTIENTNFMEKKPGDRVNIEVDILGKYVESFLKARSGGITVGLLEKTGFV